MKPRPTVFRIQGWVHNPRIRKSRFRCQHCSRLIADGSNVVLERRPGGTHGYHAECFEAGSAGQAAMSRNQEHMEGK